ncbi:MAG TPA: DUF3592 domain-containing protein [Sedimentisphaerales bacterium]|nr:DUF3592 domain-containing protein [Sedimentisphaerales bacterium]
MSRSGKTRLVLTGVGVLLVVLAVRSAALRVVGKPAQATVTDVKRATGQQDDPMDHNYQIAYRFAVDGKDYRGSLTRKKVYNAATLPHVGAMVPIRYLASAPTINGDANESILGVLVLGVLGIALCVFGIKPPRAKAPETLPADAQPDAQS